jgi:Arc/MetJ-type ribon-helix-helix transcriptional regulator
MKKKITIALDENILSKIDREVDEGKAKNRSAAIESHLIKYYGDFTDASAIIFSHDDKWDNREYPFETPKSLLLVR